MAKDSIKNRNHIIIRTSVIGIIANLLLVVFKAAVGLISNSIAIIMDALNNLSDALSSVITIAGTKLSQRDPDKKHPLGHGRIEYLSATVISAIILFTGAAALVESVKAVINPQTPDYSVTSLIIVGAAIAVKVFLGIYVKKKGKEVNSDSLVASGSDAMFDAWISASTMAAAVIFIAFNISLEAWLGAVIAVIIIKSGIDLLRETISKIVGERIDSSLARAVKECIASFPEVGGAYDLIIHNYGPEYLIGSVHIELPDTMTIQEADTLERQIVQKVFDEHGVVMAGISVYAANTGDEDVMLMKERILNAAKEYPDVLQIHGFYADKKTKNIKFDIVIDMNSKDRKQVYSGLVADVENLFPDYSIEAFLDADISE